MYKKLNIIYFVIIIILVYVIWYKNNLIVNMQESTIKDYSVFIEHALGKVYKIKWHYSRSYNIKSYNISLMIMYEEAVLKNHIAYILHKENSKMMELYQSMLLYKPDLYKWIKIGNVEICEIYLGDKDYLYAEVMQYELNDTYIKLFLVYTEEVKNMLKTDELWPVLLNEDKLKIEIKKPTVRMTKGEISERCSAFNELKDTFFSNYRKRPAFFIIYNNNNFQLLLGQEFKFLTYSDLFEFKRTSILKYYKKNRKEILDYYLNKSIE